MNTTPFQPQIVEFLVKGTLLLAFAWAIHGLLRPSHPRWRALLWRVIFCGILLLPLLSKGLPPVRVPAPLWMAAARSETKPMGKGNDPKLSEGAAVTSMSPLLSMPSGMAMPRGSFTRSRPASTIIESVFPAKRACRQRRITISRSKMGSVSLGERPQPGM